MFFDIDFQNPKPVYQQMMDQIKYAVASGRLRPGDRLPSIRDAAVEARVNRNTIARVYAELEREGVVHSRAGQGVFVSERGSTVSDSVRREQLVARLDELLAQAHLFEFSREQIADLFGERLAAVYGGARGRRKGAGS